MIDVPDDARQYINSEFARRLENNSPDVVDVLVETEPGVAQDVAQEITQREGYELTETGTFAGRYISLTVPVGSIPELARVDGVELVHQDQPAGVMDGTSPFANIPILNPEADPIQSALSDALYNSFEPTNEFAETVRIGEVEVPQINFTQLPPGNPFQAAATAIGQAGDGGLQGETLIPTSRAVEWIRDANVTDGAVRETTKVAVVDTGHTPNMPENGSRTPRLESYVPGEPPLDGQGHGSWCTNMTVANSAPGIWGSTAGVASGSVYGHFKALNTFPGFGKTSWILKAMTAALQWGADVISMSLGGDQQGPVGEDPYTRFIAENCKENAGDENGAIFVIAAGNAGPDKWTIGSPGVAPKALTVASWSMTDESPAVFSSRGPQGNYYGKNPDEYQSDLAQFGAQEFVKPDVAAPGGGRENDAKTDENDELLFQSSYGWYDGLKDGIKDGRASMKGTSMATPAVAGLVKRLYDAGIVRTAAEVKQVVSERQTVPPFPDAEANANEAEDGKHIAVGFGPIRESLFAPDGEGAQ